MSGVSAQIVVKPRFRGVSHGAAFFAALAAAVLLLRRVSSPDAATAAWVYSAVLVNLYASSSLYHLPNWRPRARLWLRRLDHVAIYLLIGGTGTAVAAMALAAGDRSTLLWTIWAAVAFGIVKAVLWIRAPKALAALVYIAIGAVGTPFVPGVLRGAGLASFLLLAAGCMVYVAGAVVYAARRPDPAPEVFGYHEIFHALVIAASVLHFSAIYRMA